VWAAFTTSDSLRSRLAPNAEIDLRVGGLMRTNYKGRLGDPDTIENAIRETWTVVYFSPAGPNQTQVREVSLGFSADPESQRMRAFFNHGDASTLSQLQRHFARR
jgi:hypothetical protein